MEAFRSSREAENRSIQVVPNVISVDFRRIWNFFSDEKLFYWYYAEHLLNNDVDPIFALRSTN